MARMKRLQTKLGVGAQRVTRRLVVIAQMLRLNIANLLSRISVLDPRGPVVSLTTYGARAGSVYLVIESIGKGTLRPSRLMLWVDEPDLFHRPPASLRRLQARGLEILLCENLGPHKKYYPFVASQDSFPQPLVTADDDILYPRYWLEGLAQGHRESPGTINCYRARVVSMKGREFAPYRDWPLCTETLPSVRHVANGCSGVIYPPEFLYELKRAGEAFRECCPKADDLWLHVNEIRSGYKIRQMSETPLHFPLLPGTQTSGLQVQNVGQDGNDRQIRATYLEADMALLLHAEEPAA